MYVCIKYSKNISEHAVQRKSRAPIYARNYTIAITNYTRIKLPLGTVYRVYIHTLYWRESNQKIIHASESDTCVRIYSASRKVKLPP